ncbi:MAG: hypothetical protein Q7S40_03500 [Opitutaceae bacterium]|nr:hypothetical protein [Opitutaceae bacterium]
MSKITFQLGTDNAPFKKGLADAEKQAEKSAGTIAGALGNISTKAAAVGGAMALAGKAVFEFLKSGFTEATKLADLASNLNVSTDSLQAFDYAARTNGATLEQVTKALEMVSLKSQDLIDGNEQMTAAFGKLGLRAKDFIGLNADERLAAVATAFAGATDKGQALNAVAEILGTKVGPKLVATLNEIGGQGLAGLTDAARKAGQVIEEDVIKRLDKFDDRLSRIGKRIKLFGADAVDSVIGLGQWAMDPAGFGEKMINEEIAGRQKEEAAKKAAKAAETIRAKAAADAKKAKDAEKRDQKEKPKLDAYIRQKNANDEETDKQRMDNLTPPSKRKVELTRQRESLQQELEKLPPDKPEAKPLPGVKPPAQVRAPAEVKPLTERPEAKPRAEGQPVVKTKREELQIKIVQIREEEKTVEREDEIAGLEAKKIELAKKRLELEKEMAALPRNQIDGETKRGDIRKRILAITKDEKDTGKKLADIEDKAADEAERRAKDAQTRAEKLKDATEDVAKAVKKVGEAQKDVNNAQFDPFRFTLSQAASGQRGSGRAQQNAKIVGQKEKQVGEILDRNNLEFDESGKIRYIAAPGESPEAIREKQKIAETQTAPRLQKLMGGAANLRKATANLDRKEQDPTAQAKKAHKEAIEEAQVFKDMKKALDGKFKVQ